MPTSDRRREVLQTIIDDCDTDATALDSTPFTPQGMGPVLGQMLAQIQALTKIVLSLLPEEEADV